MKIALVHDFLTQLGGAERVLKNFLSIWPEAVLHVLIYNEEKTKAEFAPYKKEFSFLHYLPFAKKDPKLFLALTPSAVQSFDFKNYDVVISDSSSFVKGVNTEGKLHICYCHTPTRFLWTDHDYLESQPYPRILKALAKPVLKWLKGWDYRAAQKPNFLIANSKNVQNRIKKFYNRDSEVIYPPVDTEIFKPTGIKKDYYLVASRLEPYKKIELAVEAFNELGLRLKVAGSGTRAENLKALAGQNVEFLGRVSDSDLAKLYAEAQAFIFPAEDDAGIMLLESQAAGTPVIAYGAGGALELVKDGETGILFKEQTKESLKTAVNNFQTMNFDSDKIRSFALQFDSKNFQKKINEFVEQKYQEYKA